LTEFSCLPKHDFDSIPPIPGLRFPGRILWNTPCNAGSERIHAIGGFGYMKRALVIVFLLLACSAVASAQQLTYYYAHITSGAFPGGSWQTTIFITNASGAGGAATGTITLTSSDGNPW